MDSYYHEYQIPKKLTLHHNSFFLCENVKYRRYLMISNLTTLFSETVLVFPNSFTWCKNIVVHECSIKTYSFTIHILGISYESYALIGLNFDTEESLRSLFSLRRYLSYYNEFKKIDIYFLCWPTLTLLGYLFTEINYWLGFLKYPSS